VLYISCFSNRDGHGYLVAIGGNHDVDVLGVEPSVKEDILDLGLCEVQLVEQTDLNKDSVSVHVGSEVAVFLFNESVSNVHGHVGLQLFEESHLVLSSVVKDGLILALNRNYVLSVVVSKVVVMLVKRLDGHVLINVNVLIFFSLHTLHQLSGDSSH